MQVVRWAEGPGSTIFPIIIWIIWKVEKFSLTGYTFQRFNVLILILDRVKGSSFENVPDHDSDIDLGSEDDVDHLRIPIQVNEEEYIVYA